MFDFKIRAKKDKNAKKVENNISKKNIQKRQKCKKVKNVQLRIFFEIFTKMLFQFQKWVYQCKN